MNKRLMTIGKSCELNRESITANNTPDSIYYLDTGNITRNRIYGLHLLQKNNDGYPSRAKRKVKNNTIIYSTVRPNQEHHGILNKPADNLIVSTGFTTIDVIDNGLDQLYLYTVIP